MNALFRGNRIFAWLALLTLGVVAVVLVRSFRGAGPGSATAGDDAVTRFDEITVRRLNVIEPDGKPRVVISSQSRMPNAIWNGKEYSHRSHGGGGFLFFNDDGTEAGGMGFTAGRTEQGFGAQTNLNFDQYQQDNTLQLIYNDDNGRRYAGLVVKDRPDTSLLPALELIDELSRAGSDAERARLTARLKQLESELAPGTAQRVFAGKEFGAALVRLADPQGRPRLVLRVDETGEAGIDLLDAGGAVVNRIRGN